MKNSLLFLLAFLIPAIFFAQDITGVWQGYSSRSNPDCSLFPETFLITYFLEQNGNEVSGTAEIIVEGTPYFAIYTLTSGNLTDNIFLFTADPTQNVPPPGFFWCTSIVGELELFEAEGLLEGISSSIAGDICCEANIYLRKLELLSDTIYCPGELVELEVTGENVQWYADNNLDTLIGTGNTLEVIIEGPTSFFITQTFSVINEETTPIRFDIEVYDSQITAYEIITTNACNDNNGSIEILLEDDIDAQFTIADNFSTNNLIEGLTAADYTLTIQDENGCEIDTSFQIIDEDCFIEIPNVFTPDGDGINDLFRIVPSYDFQGEILLFQVYNRWGQQVIDLQNQNIEDAIWDGTLNNKPLPSDVYVYIFKIAYSSGRQESFHGDLTLLR